MRQTPAKTRPVSSKMTCFDKRGIRVWNQSVLWLNKLLLTRFSWNEDTAIVQPSGLLNHSIWKAEPKGLTNILPKLDQTGHHVPSLMLPKDVFYVADIWHSVLEYCPCTSVYTLMNIYDDRSCFYLICSLVLFFMITYTSRQRSTRRVNVQHAKSTLNTSSLRSTRQVYVQHVKSTLNMSSLRSTRQVNVQHVKVNVQHVKSTLNTSSQRSTRQSQRSCSML